MVIACRRRCRSRATRSVIDRERGQTRGREAAAARAARRARIDHLPRHDARGPAADPRADRAASVGEDFFLAFSPEREDPGNPTFTTRKIPKVVGGIDAQPAARSRRALRSAPSSTSCRSRQRRGRGCKILENIFRCVNIALVNELKMLFDRMDIDVWEVIDAATTKPFGFMPFYPGPGPRRPLHPDRPVLPDVEGPRVRLRRPASSSSPARSTRTMPYYVADSSSRRP